MSASTLLAPARAIKVVRDPGDPPPIREETDSLHPHEVDSRIVSIANELAAEHGCRPADFALGAYRTEYRYLYGLYSALVTEVGRLRAESFGYFPDEA